MRSYGGLLEPRGSDLTQLKSTFNAEDFVLQVVLVYLEWFRRNSLVKCVLQPKIAKKSLKPLFWGFKVVQGHRCSGLPWIWIYMDISMDISMCGY